MIAKSLAVTQLIVRKNSKDVRFRDGGGDRSPTTFSAFELVWHHPKNMKITQDKFVINIQEVEGKRLAIKVAKYAV